MKDSRRNKQSKAAKEASMKAPGGKSKYALKRRIKNRPTSPIREG